MANFIQLRVNCGAITKLVVFSKDSGVDEIYMKISNDLCIGDEHHIVQLHHKAELLKYGEGKILRDYNLVHQSGLDLLVGVLGGIWPLKAIQERKQALVPLPGFITVTTSPNDVDMISQIADKNEKRAKMPCGHVIGPSSMTSYCQSLLSEGQYKFYCPSVDEKGNSNCNREWQYFLVRHVACLSEVENQAFESKTSENYLKKSNGMQQCPGCSIWCFKDSGTKQYVRCQMCKKNFCWACLRDWKGASDAAVCGNADCNNTRAEILESCKKKEIKQCKECPSIRVCPKCLMLVEHKAACGHMICPSCKHGFCMICLEPKINDSWSCSSLGTCPVAPCQKLPSSGEPTPPVIPSKTSDAEKSAEAPKPKTSNDSWCTII